MRKPTTKLVNDAFTNVGIRKDIKAVLDARRGPIPFRSYLDALLRGALRQRGVEIGDPR